MQCTARTSPVRIDELSFKTGLDLVNSGHDSFRQDAPFCSHSLLAKLFSVSTFIHPLEHHLGDALLNLLRQMIKKLGSSSLLLPTGIGVCLLLAAVALARSNESKQETASTTHQQGSIDLASTPSHSEKSPTKSSSVVVANSLSELSVATLPKELYAKSALELVGFSLPDSVLDSKTTKLLLPLSKNKIVELATSQVVQKGNGRTILFGQLANGERSHSSLVFDRWKIDLGQPHLL